MKNNTTSTQTVINDNSSIYYNAQYWNDLPVVIEYMSENFTGDSHKWWVTDFQERFASKPFEHAIVVNCGNGWVEREFIDKNIVKNVTAFDYSKDLLQKAEEERHNRAITYMQADVNTITLPRNTFDLAVNVAAMHHVQYINRFCHMLCTAMRFDGLFVNFDYIGPHRNQYHWKHWRYLKKVNNQLSDDIKKISLSYPHLPTMLVSDPTEAIHSELTLQTIARYFDIFERHDTNGGIAYEILSHNPKMTKEMSAERQKHIRDILAIDKQFSTKKKIPPLFSYFIARPQKNSLKNIYRIQQYQHAEDQREKYAQSHGQIYYLRDRIILFLYRLHTIIKSLRRRFL